MSHHRVIAVDVRPRISHLSNETVVTGDVSRLGVDPETVEMVTSLCSIEHFGLGRYGDRFDLSADEKAVGALIRALRPGGHFVFSVPVTGGSPCLAFNSHRIYSLEMVRRLMDGLRCRDERFVKTRPAALGNAAQLPTVLGEFDIYCGAYQKP